MRASYAARPAARERTMRVVHLSFHRDPAGRDAEALLHAWPTLLEHAAAVQEAGIPVAVVQAAAQDALVERRGVPFRFVRTRARRLARPHALLTALLAERPTVIHVHGLVHGPALWWLHRVAAADRIIVQDHGTRPPRGWRAWWWRRLLQGAHVAFTSAAQAEAWRSAGAMGPATTSHAVPEASCTFTPAARDAARTATGVHGEPALLWLGRLDHNKDPLTVLEGVRRAASARPGLRLWMAWSGGDLEPVVRARVADDPVLRDRVTFLGALDRQAVRHHLSAADAFVQASHYEGSGYALIEALACGTPAIVTDIPAFRALLGNPPAGRLVPVGDAGAFARAIEVPLPPRRAVRTHFETNLSWPVLGARWAAIYRAMAVA